MRDACPLPQFTEIFFHKNVTDVFTPAPAKRLHYQLDTGRRTGASVKKSSKG